MASKCGTCDGNRQVPLYPTMPEHEWPDCEACGGTGYELASGERPPRRRRKVKDDPFREEEEATVPATTPEEAEAVGRRTRPRPRRSPPIAGVAQ